jgi:hypothetical protein
MKQVVEITFTDFSTEQSYDYLALYDGYNDNYGIIAILTGNVFTPVTYMSTQQYMYIKLKTDPEATAQGFRAYFTSTAYPTSTYPAGNIK